MNSKTTRSHREHAVNYTKPNRAMPQAALPRTTEQAGERLAIMETTEIAFRERLLRFAESAVLWGALGLLGGAIIPLVALKWVFAATWLLLTFAVIKERFFHKRKWVWKITGTLLVSFLMGIGFAAAWRYIPKPKAPPPLKETATLTAKKIIELMPPQPEPRSNTPTPLPNKKKESPLKAEEGFAVAVETRIFVVPGGKYGTSFWAGSLAPGGCTLKSVQAALFIRITNLQKERTLITAYTVKAMGVPLTRIKMNLYKPFVILGKGVLKASNQPGATAVQTPVPEGGIGSWVSFKLEDAYPAEARPIEAEFLDSQIAGHYLEHKQMVQGWAYFQYPKQALIPAQLLLTISDETGHSFPYPIAKTESDQNADTMSWTISFGPTVDLSACSVER
jgi:hypothetical protein